MEALLYLFGISNYLNPEMEKARHNLTNDLKDKFHARRIDNACSPKPFSIKKRHGRKQALSKINTLRSDIASASNLKTAPYELARLAHHDNHEVRMAVCDNPNTPTSEKVKLSHDSHLDVRFRMAENYHVPQFILINLLDDENPYISCRAQTTLDRLAMDKMGSNSQDLYAL